MAPKEFVSLITCVKQLPLCVTFHGDIAGINKDKDFHGKGELTDISHILPNFPIRPVMHE